MAAPVEVGERAAHLSRAPKGRAPETKGLQRTSGERQGAGTSEGVGCRAGSLEGISRYGVSEATGTKVLQGLNVSRSDIVTGPRRGVPSVFPDAGRSLQLGRVFSLHNYRPQQQRMNGALEKVLCPRNDTIFKQVFSLLRFRTSGENPICSADKFLELKLLSQWIVIKIFGGILLSTSRHYKTKPTHGIGRYKHLVKAQEPKKKRGKVEVRPINLGTDYEYGVLNIHLTAYDMALAESYAQYVHNLCNHLSIKVEESYAMPTKTMEVLRLQDQGSKMFLDSVLTTHERVVQISGLSATFAEIFLEIIQSNLPEGVRLSVKEHTEEDFKGRFKARPELEELLAKLN
ncbi:39S ribosomal protein L48, mitochondrial [Acinonyx jubatus]|uniref:39S ribosomal protein L48, mitochondrial n=1 Tax=Acinonyx jubatus TaxID=32536 RepID=A0ABM3NGF7_ACIJB|nr:39S ribosomal protein L48, mitochondrial [Acinonyx jubatus]